MRRFINAIKLHILNELLIELCEGYECRDCSSFIDRYSGIAPRCAQCYVYQQALDIWGTHEENAENNATEDTKCH